MEDPSGLEGVVAGEEAEVSSPREEDIDTVPIKATGMNVATPKGGCQQNN